MSSNQPINSETSTPPIAPQKPHTSSLHGYERVDKYRWLQDKSSAEVIKHLEAENAYAEQMLAHTRDLQEKLYQEMLGRIQQTDVSVPYREGDHLYYQRTEEGRQYPTFCRRPAEPDDAPEQLLLDLNLLAEGHPYMALGAFEPSDDGRLLAYSTDSTGFREYTLQILDMHTGQLSGERIEHVVSVVWAADNRTLFYVTEDETKRPARLWRHQLGSDAGDELIYHEPDERFRLSIERSRSGRFLELMIVSHTTSEYRLLDAAATDGEWVMIEPRRQDIEYYIAHHDEHLYIIVNDTGRNFRLVRTRLDLPGAANWQEVIPHRDSVMLQGVQTFADFLVVGERGGGLEKIRVMDARTLESHYIDFPEPAYELFPGVNRQWQTSTFRFRYTSLVTPISTFDHDVNTGENTLLKQQPVLGGFDREEYISERLHAVAGDGTPIPISLVYRRDRTAPGPLLLHGYGSYGFPYPVHFDSARLSLLERGFAVAIAHIRGGGEMGKTWHDAGRMGNKMNSFTDFISCAEHLVDQGYTTSDQLAIEGGSAGGLLMGAVVNMRPDLFGAVVSLVPFVDVLNTMLDPSLPLTVGEYEEWGNPAEKPSYDYIAQYCPYTNVAECDYPAILVRTSLNDSQVMYWEPAKYVARMREMRTDDSPLLLVTNMGAGHGGASGRYDHLRETALDYAFVIDAVG